MIYWIGLFLANGQIFDLWKIIYIQIFDLWKIIYIQFRRLALKSPPLGPKWGRWAKKLRCASNPPIPADCRLEDRMRTRVFSPTYPTWALVGGTSRPAGETVYLFIIADSRYLHRYLLLLNLPPPVCPDTVDICVDNIYVTQHDGSRDT